MTTAMSADGIISRNRAFEAHCYDGRAPVAFVRGQGCELWDADGNRYLDLLAGLGVNNLGHCHPAVVEAVQRQAATLMHASNLYHTEPTGEVAALLCELSFADRVFLCNSGAEANEAALKLARRWGADRGGGRFEVLATQGSFHGRTFATLTATGQEKYHQGFLPLLPGIRLVPYDDAAAMRAAVRDETVAILVEPIQGEGGVVVPGPGYLAALRALADEKKLLLIFDEVQCGMGRTGQLFAHEHYGVTPDIMTLAKGLGGGLPIGAMLAPESISTVMTPGTHASTFGGNPVTCAAATAAVDALSKPALLEHVRAMGRHLRAGLETLAQKHRRIVQVRGVGLMVAAVLDGAGGEVVERCRQAGVLINCTADRVLRFLPPLVVTEKELDEGLIVLDEVLST